ncbi:MAG TPA: hypothetical protein VL325_10365 [Pyrinomonadaceae bacterium]|jgi:hypothetical protein|nr:hypothetical protein [Pyrinomonadaceae bacterium]
MTRIREEFDADRFGTSEKTSEFPFGDQQLPVTCGICGATRYVSKEVSGAIESAIEAGDNPFVCEKCERDFEEAAHAGG